MIGEEIGHFGGSYRITEGLLEKYGELRVVDTPISEEGFVGAAIGSAMTGLRPVVELMTVNFSLVAFDQIVQNAAKLRYMFGGEVSAPIVLRMPGGAGHQLSSQHSHSFEALYASIPGLVVVAPTTPEDAKGMLKAAIRSNDPVIFHESMSLYNIKGEVPGEDYTTPIGRAALRRQGTELTIIGVSRQAFQAGQAASRLAEEEIDVELIDLRSLRPLDWTTLTESVKKTSRCLVVEEGWSTYGVGAELAAGLQERCFDYLDAPIRRIGSAEVPMPYNRQLEKAAIPSVEDIVRAAQQLVGRGGE
ncbi:MAG: alpha-ketoacid dehydrogenase subunit beta, partial [Candidatus Dormibacteraceae bacterium]